MDTQKTNHWESNDAREVPFWQPALLMFSRLSGWIIGPIILAVFLGKWLDRRYDTEPWLFLATVGAAFIISTIGLVRDALREMDKLTNSHKSGTNSHKSHD